MESHYGSSDDDPELVIELWEVPWVYNVLTMLGLTSGSPLPTVKVQSVTGAAIATMPRPLWPPWHTTSLLEW